MLRNVQVLAGTTSVARFDNAVVWFETGGQGGGAMLEHLLEAVHEVSSGSVPPRLMGARLAAVLNSGDSTTVPALAAATPEGQGLRVVVHGWGSVVADGIHVPNGWVDQVINDRRTFFLGRNTVSPLAPVEGSALDLEDGVVPGDGVSFALASTANASAGSQPAATPAPPPAPTPLPATPAPAPPPWAPPAEPLPSIWIPPAEPVGARPPAQAPSSPSPWAPSAAPVAAAPPAPASVPLPVEPPAYEPPPSDPPPGPSPAPAPARFPAYGSGPAPGLGAPGPQAPPVPADPTPLPPMASGLPTDPAGWSDPTPLPPGRLVLDDGRSAVLERTCVLGSAPQGSPAVQTGVAMPLTVTGTGVAPVHIEIRVEPGGSGGTAQPAGSGGTGNVSVRDLGSAPSYVLLPGGTSWSPLVPGQVSALVPGSRIAIGQRTISYERP